MTIQTKILMLAGMVGLVASLTGCGDSRNNSQSSNPEPNKPAQAKPVTANSTDDALKDLAEEIKKMDEEIKKAADDLGEIKEKTNKKVKVEPNNVLGREISVVVGSDAEDKLAYLTELKARPGRMRGTLETVRKGLKIRQIDNNSQTSTDTAWDVFYYLGATLLLALFVGLAAGWGAGTLAAKRKLTKAGFW